MFRRDISILLLAVSLFACREKEHTLFSEAQGTGIDFTNTVTDNRDFNIFNYRNFYNGAGVAIGDINNDGLADVFFTANMGENKLYLNRGNWKFEDISRKAGFGPKQKWSTGVTMADINGDGLLDIYVCNAGYQQGVNRENELWINTGNLHFEEQAVRYGLNDSGFTTHAAFFDYDLDGDLDCYILNNSFIPVNTLNYSNKRDLRAEDWPVPDFMKGGGDRLLRNDGKIFTDVSRDAGIYGSLIGFGLGVTVGDVNGDNYPDIYVSNDFFERDYLYINRHDGTFSEELESRMQHLSHSSMGADMADINNDGLNDLFVTEMLPDDDYRLKTTTSFESLDVFRYKVKSGFYYQYMQNTLQLNIGGGVFSEIAHHAGVSASDWSWGALVFDADNDGLSDIYVCNGINHDVTDQDFIDFFANDVVQKMVLTGQKEEVDEVIKKMPSRPLRNKFFHNKGGYQFADAGDSSGMDRPTFSNGAAYGDLDNDGDLDLVVSNVNQPALVYRNNNRELGGNHFIGIQLKGKGLNRFAVGSTVHVFSDGTQFMKELVPSRGFQSSVDYKLVFGLGNHTKVDSLIIEWPDRTVSTRLNLAVDSVYSYTWDDSGTGPTPPAPVRPLFQAVTDSIFESHREDDYFDFYQERNIPRMNSREGPRAAVADVNGDGRDDIYIGGASGQAGQIYIQGTNGFEEKPQPVFEYYKDCEDLALTFFDADGDGDPDLFAAGGGNNRPSFSKQMQHRLYLNDGQGNFSIGENSFPPCQGNTSVVLVKDLDGDGDADLFTGSASVPVSYGLIPTSAVYLNNGKGQFTELPKDKYGGLSQAGMIHAGCWADITGDGKDELLVAGEWMGVKAYQISGNAFREITTGLSALHGWWYSMTADDLDGDGDKDLVIGNTGNNFYLRPDARHPVRLWVNRFDQSAARQVILTRSIDGKDMPVFLKKDLTDQIPALKKQNLKHTDFATKSIRDLFSPVQIDSSLVLKYDYPNSIIAWNEGNSSFTVSILPPEVQLSVVTAILATDINGDGKKDLILGGNQFDWLPQFSRLDASKGHVLVNKGNRQWQYLPYLSSGILVKGQVRDLTECRSGNRRMLMFLQNNDFPACYYFPEPDRP